MRSEAHRTCTELQGDNNASPKKFRVEELRELDAYVLLGDPGSGKTFLFRNEAAMPECDYVSARNLMTLAIRPEWKGKTLFIDGLDETRAGGLDGRTPLDKIRSRLEEIAGPRNQRFRISCREADWLGASDRASIEQVAPANEIRVFHLDPLTDEQILAILSGRKIRGTPEEFIQSARAHNLDELLRNPQTLFLLVEAVGTSGWPTSREEVFRLACDKLITEPNPEHRAATQRTAPPKPELLRAAGYLSALQLIADIAEFSIGEHTDPGVIDLNEIPWKDLPLRDVVPTRFFSSPHENTFAPVHRSVAEYLGASFLSEAVREGLPIRRVLALIRGVDGGVVSGLRGLHAWLAFHLPEYRLNLCEVDPLGVTLYGAAGSFAVDEKRQLLAALATEIERSEGHAIAWSVPPASALATEDMAETFRNILQSPSRLPKDQLLARFVLDAIASGTSLPKLAPIIWEVVRDSGRWPSVRQHALDAFKHVQPAENHALLQLANDIQTDKTDDPDDSLLGEILYALFPAHIGPQTVLNFLHPRKQRDLIGRYDMFWSHGVAERLRPDDTPILLDALATRTELWHQRPTNFMLRRLVGSVLAEGLHDHGTSISVDRLFSWLGIPLGEHFELHLDNNDQAMVRSWVRGHPERYLELLLVVVDRVRTLGDYWRSFFQLCRRFCGATVPPDMPKFWLQLAENESNSEFAEFLFKQAVRPLFHEGSTEHPIEYFESWVKTKPAFASALAAERYEEIPEWRKEDAEQKRNWDLEEKTRKQEWISHFRNDLQEKPGNLHPQALHDLSAAYFGHLLEAEGDTPRVRLGYFLDNDRDLIEGSLKSFVATLERPDLPSVEAILDLAAKDRMHLVRSPCLAGIEEVWEADPRNVDTLNNETLSKIVAFRYTEGTGNEPDWFKHLVTNRPELIAPVLTAYVTRMLRAGKEHIHGLWQMAFDDDYAAVARLVTPQLLEAFPTRLKKGQAESLEYVLKSALRHCRNTDLRNAIGKRLRNRSIDVAQRVYWLACGLIVDPTKYEKTITRYIGANHERREHLGAFLTGREDRRTLPQDAPPSTLGLLIRLLGPGNTSERPDGAHWVTPAMRSSDLVGALIDRLSGTPDQAAALEIERLGNDPALSDWRSRLRRAAYVQQISRREAAFRHPTPAEVLATLGKGRPANVADLAAIALDVLEDVALETRRGNADAYKLYWNVDRFGRIDHPRPEESCRDALLSHVGPKLKPLGIDVHSEARHADGKRSDLKVTYTAAGLSASVAIEMKRDSHPELWRTIANQLIPSYTGDPNADGHGIYLVLWFGDRRIPHPPTGKKPSTAQELRLQLEATIEPSRRGLISVVVFDCAAPIAGSRDH